MRTEGNQGLGSAARLILTAGTAVYRLYYSTVRVRLLLTDGSAMRARSYRPGRGIFALCEADALAVGGLLAGAGFTVLVTVGRDGDRAAFALERLGCTVVRGSSRLGGAEALRGLVRHLESTAGPAAIVVDGPLGPAGIAKAGAIACAMMTGRPLHALAASAHSAFVFPGTWSGIYLPLPFTRVRVYCDDPLPLPDSSALGDVERHAETLTARLSAVRKLCQRGNLPAK